MIAQIHTIKYNGIPIIPPIPVAIRNAANIERRICKIPCTNFLTISVPKPGKKIFTIIARIFTTIPIIECQPILRYRLTQDCYQVNRRNLFLETQQLLMQPHVKNGILDFLAKSIQNLFLDLTCNILIESRICIVYW